MTRVLRLRLRAYLMILPLIVAGVAVVGVFNALATRASLTRVTNRYMAFKAEQLRDYFFSEWDVLTRLGLDKYPEYSAAVEKSFRSYAYSLLRSDTELIVVVDSTGSPLMRIRLREPSESMGRTPESAAAVRFPVGWFSTKLFGDERVGVGFDIPPMGWKAAVTELDSAFFSDAVNIQRTYVLTFAIVIAVIGVFLTILIGYIVRPVERLKVTIERIASTNDLAARARVELPDEIGLLAHMFNRMISTLQTNYRQLEETSRAEHAANKSLTESLEEKTVLLKEIHHRVKNNLQVISSLLYLQEKGANDSERAILNECRNQILAMAMIHEDLYGSADLRNVNFGAYIERLAVRLAGTFSAAARVGMEFMLDEVPLSIDRAIPCGLILNELCTNAFKHAFPNDRDGPSFAERREASSDGPRLTIGLKKTAGSGVSLSVWDNGIGFPEGLDFRTTQTVGMQIVMTLVHQLRGSIRLEPGQGVRFTVEFDAKD